MVFGALDAPQLVYYGALASGVVAYYGFAMSMDLAREMN